MKHRSLQVMERLQKLPTRGKNYQPWCLQKGNPKYNASTVQLCKYGTTVQCIPPLIRKFGTINTVINFRLSTVLATVCNDGILKLINIPVHTINYRHPYVPCNSVSDRVVPLRLRRHSRSAERLLVLSIVCAELLGRAQ